MTGFTSKSLSPLREHLRRDPGALLPRVSLSRLSLLSTLILGLALYISGSCAAQVFTVERDHIAGKTANLATFRPTSVPLATVPLSTRTREELIRLFQSEQAFAVRPLPLGRRGLTLRANGQLVPSGNAYVDELEKDGISSKPGDRLIISKFEVRQDSIVFEFNGGPDKHHRILQHIQIGGGMSSVPMAQDDGQQPVGSRLTLTFDKFVPEMNAAQLRGLIAPMLDFSLKTPIQAYADTLPPKLKAAVLDHEVLVGMNRDMVINAVGRPDQKVREMGSNNMPFEEWIYGEPPHEVQFVRFNGNRVIRLEIADVGQKLIIRDKDETDGYFAGQFVHQVRLGDAQPTGPNQEHGPQAAPTLRKPGETLPDAVDQQNQLKRVQFPKDDPKPNPIPAPPDQTADQSQAGQNQSADPSAQNPFPQDASHQGGSGRNPSSQPSQPPGAVPEATPGADLPQ